MFIALLCFSVAAIAVTSGNSQTSGIASAGVINIADTTPATHHTMMNKPVHHSTMRKTTTKTKAKTNKTKPAKTAKSPKDSTTKK